MKTMVSARSIAVRFAAVAVAAAVCGVLSITPGVAHAAAEQPPRAETQYGPVSGSSEDGLAVFRGIPYAAPPVDDLRFKAPAVPQSWTEPLSATEFGPACPQDYSELELVEGSPRSEDCLTLNVWSRSLSGNDPVIVFIHGGGFTSGAASNPWYDGADLAAHGATVVSLQYRIGPFGWLNVSDLGDEYAESMNNGLLDQIAALRWVRENIAAFGGDASNVTVVGESAGAISIAALMGAPEADGLYDRAVLQSGTAGTVATREWSENVTAEFLDGAGVESVSEIVDMSTEQLLEAAEHVYASQFADTAFHPVVDGDLIPALPAERIASDEGPDVPVLVGTTLDEARYWLYFMPDLVRVPMVYGEPWLNSLVGDRADDVIADYREERPGLSDSDLLIAMSGDVGFRMPSIRMAESLANRGVDVRMYLAEVKAIDLDGIMGSPHAVELPFVFGTTAAANYFVSDDAQNRELSERTQDLWVSFATDGQPRSGDLSWPLYDTQTRSTLILDTDLRIQNDPYPQIRETWEGLSFDGSDPGLDRLTPLAYEGSNENDWRVIAGYIGWGYIWGGLAVLLVLVAGIVLLTIWLVRRRRARRRRDAESAVPLTQSSQDVDGTLVS